jgi:hypothetical protein
MLNRPICRLWHQAGLGIQRIVSLYGWCHRGECELEKITADFTSLVAQLTSPVPTTRGISVQPLSPDELALRQLAESGKSIGNELLAVLQDLKVKGPSQQWHSFRQAMRSALRKDKIRGLEERLDRLQRQLNSRLLTIMWSVWSLLSLSSLYSHCPAINSPMPCQP